ncbi:Soluble hydrogenase 42 kDa subunit [Sedimentisphaera cyanobacteriorum]|uniref:Soluble hydrogenase 42 kDa subunit n=1 Tax=Sedimentisphaera cyanobacteriorum TaxID=1940790 RepID=A0A1Q2HMW7_9BACT|nr:alanine--glyoxylate aminotransferase family protein [Sedimentisphaera cyanobacteriorum]AQQ08700.1 Soluble hydrogenase 42 kDa subunit [Sedimentisphaera cyanobacteriorum]
MTDWKNPPKLFIPGPVHSTPEILEQLSRYTVGHRAKEYSQLHGETAAMLKKVLFTDQNVFLSTSSGSGGWECSMRNLVGEGEKVLCCMCGAFSDKYASVAKGCGVEYDELKVEWGRATTADMIDKKLASGEYSAVTFVYNETSTGVTNPVEEISVMIKEKYPDVLIFVDCVSAMAALPLKFDELGWDFAFASVQKAFAIPPGLAVFAVSDRAMQKAETVKNRGYYFDLLQFAKTAKKDQTPTTPAVPQIMALNYRCQLLLEEGMENVWERHQQMADFVRGWAKENFALFAEDEKFASNTLTTVKNTRGIDVAAVIEAVKEKHNAAFGNGYGKLKQETFRIAHMGDITLDELKDLLSWIDDEIK